MPMNSSTSIESEQVAFMDTLRWTSLVPHHQSVVSRLDFLARSGGGFGLLALWSLSQQQAPAAEAEPSEKPLTLAAARPPHFPACPRSVTWCFLDGGPSHLDLFDPKPVLTKLNGQPLPSTFKRPVTAMGRTAYTPLLASQRTFKQHGQSGTWVSD